MMTEVVQFILFHAVDDAPPLLPCTVLHVVSSVKAVKCVSAIDIHYFSVLHTCHVHGLGRYPDGERYAKQQFIVTSPEPIRQIAM